MSKTSTHRPAIENPAEEAEDYRAEALIASNFALADASLMMDKVGNRSQPKKMSVNANNENGIGILTPVQESREELGKLVPMRSPGKQLQVFRRVRLGQ